MKLFKFTIFYIKNKIRYDLGIIIAENFTVACSNLSAKNKSLENKIFFDSNLERNVYLDIYGNKNILKSELIEIIGENE